MPTRGVGNAQPIMELATARARSERRQFKIIDLLRPHRKALWPLTMPGNHGLRLDDHQRRPPFRPEVGEASPQKSVSGRQLRTFSRRALKHTDLMSEGE